MATDPDLTAAVEAAARAFHAFVVSEGHAADDAPAAWDDIDDEGKQTLVEAMGAGLRAAVPLIERAVRERASDELRTWADQIVDPGISGPRAIRRRTLLAAASKILPKLSPAELAEKIATGEAYAIHCTSLDVDHDPETTEVTNA